MSSVREATRTTRGVAPVVAATAALYLVFVVARLAAFGWDPSAFVVAGDGIADPAQAPDNLLINAGVDGYDGQAYYRLSRSPLTDELDDHGIAFTRPAYWQTRIGYPATVWLVAGGGQESLVPLAMLAVNLTAVLALALACGLLARDLGRSPWWGLLPAAWAGFVVGLAQDLTEPLAGALLAGALLALRRATWRWAAAALTAAALTRETSLVLAAAVLAVALFALVRRSDPRDQAPWWVAAVPLAGYGAWRTFVRARWSGVDAPSDNPLGPPLLELGRYAGRAAGDLAAHGENLLVLVPMLMAIAVVASALVTDPAPAHERLALGAYLVVLACLPVWDRSQAYLRWGCEPVLLGWLLLLPHSLRRLAVLAASVAALWTATSVTTYAYPR